MDLAHNLQVFIPTSVSPWNPETHVMQRVISSLWKVLREKIDFQIYCDYPPPWATDEDMANYVLYCKRLIGLQVGPVTVMDHWVGLSGLFKEFLKTLEKPVVLNVQHDWEFIEPKRIAMFSLVERMLPEGRNAYATRGPEFVRFHKRALTLEEAKRYDAGYESIHNTYWIPLIASNGWGASPHLATRHHYLETVLPHVRDRQGEDGRWGLEAPVGTAYRLDIRKMGFRGAHAKWGSYFYGSEGDPPYVKHLGDAATEFRLKRGLTTKYPNKQKENAQTN